MVDLLGASAGNVLHPEVALFSSIKTLSDNLNEAVLHQKYVVERLSVKQISRHFASSKSGVLAALKRAGIAMRAPNDSHGRPANPAYGTRLHKGQLVDSPAEQRVILIVKRMAIEGRPVTAIARKLSELGIKTRIGHTNWHHEMVRSILKRNGRMLHASKSKPTIEGKQI
jgi:hypothetical protein